MAFDLFRRKAKLLDPESEARVPPGQSLTEKWPVLSYGPTPRFDPAKWRFRVGGLVEEPFDLTYDEFMALPKVTKKNDIHCVTRWSKLDNEWEGVSVQEIMKRVRLKPEASHVMIHCLGGYTTNLPLEDFTDESCLFAYKHNGENLTPDHGWPLRLVVPKLYFWKSAKWANGLQFLAHDAPGFWELYGYHMYGDPWKEQRFQGD